MPASFRLFNDYLKEYIMIWNTWLCFCHTYKMQYGWLLIKQTRSFLMLLLFVFSFKLTYDRDIAVQFSAAYVLSWNLIFVSDSPSSVVNKQLGSMSLDEQQGACDRKSTISSHSWLQCFLLKLPFMMINSLKMLFIYIK